MYSLPIVAGGINDQPWREWQQQHIALSVYDAFQAYSKKTVSDVDFQTQHPEAFATVVRVEMLMRKRHA